MVNSIYTSPILRPGRSILGRSANFQSGGIWMVCGDSISDQANTAAGSEPDTTSEAKGWRTWFDTLTGHSWRYEMKPVFDKWGDGEWDMEGHQLCQSGWGVAELVANYQTHVLPFAPKLLSIFIGTNDIRGAASAAELDALLVQLIAMCQDCVNHGITIDLTTVISRNASDGANDWTDDEVKLMCHWNNVLRGEALTNDGIFLTDATSDTLDYSNNNGKIKAGYTSDSVHLTPISAKKMAERKIATFGHLFPRIITSWLNPADVYDADLNRYGNKIPASMATWAGTGGSKDTGVTGDAPDDWNFDSGDTTNLSCALSVGAAPTDFAIPGVAWGNWLTCAITSSGGGSGAQFIRTQKASGYFTSSANLTAGTYVEFITPYRVVAPTGGLAVIEELGVKINNVDTGVHDWVMSNGGSEPMPHDAGWDGILKSHPIYVNSVNDRFRIEHYMYAFADVNDTFSVIWGQPCLRDIYPQPTFN